MARTQPDPNDCQAPFSEGGFGGDVLQERIKKNKARERKRLRITFPIETVESFKRCNQHLLIGLPTIWNKNLFILVLCNLVKRSNQTLNSSLEARPKNALRPGVGRIGWYVPVLS